MVALEVSVLLLLLVCSGFFSSAETTFFSLNPLQVRRLTQRHPKAGALIHRLLNQPTAMLATILIGNTAINVAVAAVGFSLTRRAPGGQRAGRGVSVRGGDRGQRTHHHPAHHFRRGRPQAAGPAVHRAAGRGVCPRAAGPDLDHHPPARVLLEKLTKSFEPFFRPHGKTLSAEEFETVLDISNEEGVLNADELAMVKSIIRLEDLKVSDVMTPRVDLIGLDLTHDPATFPALARKARRNFLLLYRDQVDNVEGFLDVRKYLLDPAHRIEAARLPPYFVPENAPLNQLLDQFQREKRRIAVVVDEYGGTAGLVTRGDILEEITGEIYQELNKPRALLPAGRAGPLAGGRADQPGRNQPAPAGEPGGGGGGPTGRLDRGPYRTPAGEGRRGDRAGRAGDRAAGP
jgi:putative hemolysin